MRCTTGVCGEKLSITPRKGEYCLLDKTAGGHVGRTIFQLPGKYGKGVLVSPTIHGNLLVGPHRCGRPRPGGHRHHRRRHRRFDGEGRPQREERAHAAGHHLLYGPAAHEAGEDFVLGESAEGFFDAAGIESPGLTSAPAIGEYLAGLIGEKLGLEDKTDFDPIRKGVPHLAAMSPEERAEKIAEKPGLRQHHLPVRGSERGRDLRRHPRHPGRQDLRRGQAPHPGGHGPLPGGVLLPPGDGPAVPGA